MYYLTRDEARWIAVNIAKLPKSTIRAPTTGNSTASAILTRAVSGRRALSLPEAAFRAFSRKRSWMCRWVAAET